MPDVMLRHDVLAFTLIVVLWQEAQLQQGQLVGQACKGPRQAEQGMYGTSFLLAAVAHQWKICASDLSKDVLP